MTLFGDWINDQHLEVSRFSLFGTWILISNDPNDLSIKKSRKGYSRKEWQETFDNMQDFYNSVEWQKCRIEILTRDQYTCKCCGKKPSCNVHHLNDPRYSPELALDFTNLIVLCDQCHGEWHDHDSKK